MKLRHYVLAASSSAIFGLALFLAIPLSASAGMEEAEGEDAKQCVEIIGSEIFNKCGYTIEVTWCSEGKSCRDGKYSATWNISGNGNFPHHEGKGATIRYGACKGRDSITTHGFSNYEYSCGAVSAKSSTSTGLAGPTAAKAAGNEDSEIDSEAGDGGADNRTSSRSRIKMRAQDATQFISVSEGNLTNTCGYAVDVVWCVEGQTCGPQGSFANSRTVEANGSFPHNAIGNVGIQYGACRGRDTARYQGSTNFTFRCTNVMFD